MPKRFRSPNRSAETGAATVAAVAMIVVLISVTGGGLLLGSTVIARHRAQAAADLAALAGAARVPGGPSVACAQATALAVRNGAGEISCAVEELDVIIAVAAAVPGWRFGVARAAARAGPVD